MNESDMQSLFGKYVQKHPPGGNEVYELKMTSGKSIPFSVVKDHQIENLQRAEEGAYYHRITDQPVFRGSKRRFTIQKPFDCLSMTEARGYVIAWFYKPRKKKVFIKIRIDAFLNMKEWAKRKSFTEPMALMYGVPIFP